MIVLKRIYKAKWHNYSVIVFFIIQSPSKYFKNTKIKELQFKTK